MHVSSTLRDTELTQPSHKHPLKETHIGSEIMLSKKFAIRYFFQIQIVASFLFDYLI